MFTTFATDAVAVSPGTIIAGLVAIISTLAGSVGLLHRNQTARADKTEERLTHKLDECEHKHESATTQMMKIEGELGLLKGRMEGHAQAREDLRGLSDYVIQHLHKEEPRDASGG